MRALSQNFVAAQMRGRPEPGEPNPGSYSITVMSQIQILLAFLYLAQICKLFLFVYTALMGWLGWVG
jgi:hypothetical protein